MLVRSNPEIKDYHELLNFVSHFGHGVFTANMLKNEAQRIPLRMFIKRNPQFFLSFQGGPGGLNVYSLTKAGGDHFCLKFQATRSMSYEAHIDMALINAFMIQHDLQFKYSYGPDFRIKLDGKILSLFSLRWGLPKNIHDVDGLIMHGSQYKKIDDKSLSILSSREKISLDRLKKVFENSHLPLH